MTYDILGPGALDYVPCRYGTSKLVFRGPQRALEAPYVAFIGGTHTFGKFIEQPFPLRVEHLTGVTSVNFGQLSAGVDVFLKDAVVLGAAQKARVTVVEILGAGNLSNQMYAVHPRRNDRFLYATVQLKRLYREVDFAQFNFTQHMLQHLFQLGEERFGPVRGVLQKMWLSRMRQFLGTLGGEVVLLRFTSGLEKRSWPPAVGWEPLFVTDEMVDSLGGLVSAIVDVPVAQDVEEIRLQGMVYNLFEEEAAKAVPPPRAHTDAAQALRPVLDRLM